MIHFYFKDKLINDFFYKDVFCVPVELGKKLNKRVELNFVGDSNNLENPYNKNIKVVIHKNYFYMFLYFLKNIKKIDILGLFHIYRHSILFSYIYKILNKKGKVYIKGDFNQGSINNLLYLNKKYNKLLLYFLNKIDIISFESKIFYNFFINEVKFTNKVLIIRNALYSPENIKINSYNEKKNIILVVGRIYFEEFKRYTFLLKSLLNIKEKLNGWKIIFIGNTSGKINGKTFNFEKENKELINMVLEKKIDINFVGPIYNRKELYNYFNKSKLYCISSFSEGDPLVQYEAMYYSNIMVSTDTGTIKENYYKDGLFISDINNRKEYENNLIKAIELTKSNNIDNIYKKIHTHCKENFTWNNNLKNLINILGN